MWVEMVFPTLRERERESFKETKTAKAFHDLLNNSKKKRGDQSWETGLTQLGFRVLHWWGGWVLGFRVQLKPRKGAPYTKTPQMVSAFNFKPFIKKKENAPKTKVVPHKYFESHNSDAVHVHTAAAFGGGNIGDFPL